MSLHRLASLGAAAAVVAFLAACDAGAPENDGAAPAQLTYTCCSATDVDTLYHPGQTMSVHWMVEGPATGSPQVELTASLTGPYPTADELKADDSGTAAGKVTFTAAPVRPAGTPGEHPVSTIAIGSDARPGYYNLTTSMKQGGATDGGASIVRVVARA